jgi:hypothetical protein
MTPQSEAPDEEPLDYDGLVAANRARRLYLAEHNVPAPADLQYAVSLLEFMIAGTGGEGLLAQARVFHEVRIAPILDKAVEQLTVVEDRRASAAARSRLLGGVPGVPPRG